MGGSSSAQDWSIPPTATCARCGLQTRPCATGYAASRRACAVSILRSHAARSATAGADRSRSGAVPIVSRLPDASQVIVCTAYAGHGFALGVRVGQLLGEVIVDGAALPGWGAMQAAGT